MDLELSSLHPQDRNDSDPHEAQPGSGPLAVIVQPSECMGHEPPAEPVPDYMCYSKLTILFCTCLGAGALYFSRATRLANATGQRRKAARNSQIALILNHVGIVVGVLVFVLVTVYKFLLE
ncbi:hypothetical protein Q8A67_008250 [Cirrhinus molitorella]|uniref:Synapse differentiation-inducing gene protein 1-like n=1 Tax=Cirrhinus molitorella TaxID=172907 RepID=A0AA88U127_9TELE|nr:hypothetical protein Q8A67_008250 [Cirrhinus molitorella]